MIFELKPEDIIIKIESHPFYPINFDDFLGDEAKKIILLTQGPIHEILVNKKKMRIGGLENLSFFELVIFYFIIHCHIKISQNL